MVRIPKALRKKLDEGGYKLFNNKCVISNDVFFENTPFSFKHNDSVENDEKLSIIIGSSNTQTHSEPIKMEIIKKEPTVKEENLPVLDKKLSDVKPTPLVEDNCKRKQKKSEVEYSIDSEKKITETMNVQSNLVIQIQNLIL